MSRPGVSHWVSHWFRIGFALVSHWFRIVENKYALKLHGQLAPPAQAEGWPTTWPRLAHGLRWSGVRTALISKLFLNASRAGPQACHKCSQVRKTQEMMKNIVSFVATHHVLFDCVPM